MISRVYIENKLINVRKARYEFVISYPQFKKVPLETFIGLNKEKIESNLFIFNNEKLIETTLFIHIKKCKK
jgi:hypothetical protein